MAHLLIISLKQLHTWYQLIYDLHLTAILFVFDTCVQWKGYQMQVQMVDGVEWWNMEAYSE